jgi:hypothetical protein
LGEGDGGIGLEGDLGEGDRSYESFRFYELVARGKTVKRGGDRVRGRWRKIFLTAKSARNAESGRFW